MMWPIIGTIDLLNLLWWSDQEEWGSPTMWHIWGRGEAHKRFWLEKQRERKHLDDVGVDGKDNIKMGLK